MRNNIHNSTSPKALAAPFFLPTLGDAMDEVRLSVDRFYLLAGVEALYQLALIGTHFTGIILPEGKARLAP